MLAPGGSFYVVTQNNIHRGELNDLNGFVFEYFLTQGLDVTRVFHKVRPHQGRRNISADHPLVLKKQEEVMIRAQKC
jgi:hypothetical protein